MLCDGSGEQARVTTKYRVRVTLTAVMSEK